MRGGGTYLEFFGWGFFGQEEEEVFYPRNFPVDMIYKPHPDSYLQVMSACRGVWVRRGPMVPGGGVGGGDIQTNFFF